MALINSLRNLKVASRSPSSFLITIRLLSRLSSFHIYATMMMKTTLRRLKMREISKESKLIVLKLLIRSSKMGVNLKIAGVLSPIIGRKKMMIRLPMSFSREDRRRLTSMH